MLSELFSQEQLQYFPNSTAKGSVALVGKANNMLK